jgi:hypothetical protein
MMYLRLYDQQLVRTGARSRVTGNETRLAILETRRLCGCKGYVEVGFQRMIPNPWQSLCNLEPA